MELGQKIKTLRTELHLTLEDVGKEVGVGKSTVRKWESGEIANMRRDKIAKLAKALHTTPAYLMGWEDGETGSNTTVKSSTIDLTAHEEKVVKAYRANPDLQPAVDKLLSVPAEEKVYKIKAAARNGEFIETTITDSDLEKIKNLPDADGF